MHSFGCVLAYLSPETYIPIVSWIVGALGVLVAFGSSVLSFSLACVRRIRHFWSYRFSKRSDLPLPGDLGPPRGLGQLP